MAFDQATRNRLQRFVNDVRRVLEEEFTRQLQNDYGMDPNSGSVADLTSLRHINDAQRETARILRDTLAHYTASGDMNATQGLDRIVREQAFTVLNRLAALRMAEARGLLVESVGNGFQAKGFQLYARLAGTGLGETGDAYRVYLFSVFDELGQDLPGLFDRYSPQGRLFPREAALLQVLNLINYADIAPLWSEDETIGWVYQYFNSKEERKAMRDASQAPRNSRELAVRNQFFTPRYVVEFLVDNTLGRLWFNATGGATSLRDRCQYLLVKPDETPQAATKLRDPRTLKLLDPACGSMHFGLYAFDLFAEIYREAWAWERQNGPGSLDVSTQPQAALKPLSQTYEDEEAFLRDVPRLIIEHNVYGVDIDPRAAQIASLALWLRAQRAWHDAGVKAKDRPLIGRGHVVAAIAPPAERELRKQFAANLDQRDAELFEKTLQLLKGLPELGVLLQVERELPHLIRQVYVGKGTGLFAAQEQENWQQAEARLRAALTEFAQAAKSTYQGRLFAQDALQGLRLIDLCRELFDVVVMNPPFGDLPNGSADYINRSYGESNSDIGMAFVSRMTQLIRQCGLIGAITNRTCLATSQLSKWRMQIPLGDYPMNAVADLGYGVLDTAMVEAAAYVLGGGEKILKGFRLLDSRAKDRDLLDSVLSYRNGNVSHNLQLHPITSFKTMPLGAISYWAPQALIDLMLSKNTLGRTTHGANDGGHTGDDFRFLRAVWECSPDRIGRNKQFVLFAKGGEYSPFWDDVHLVMYWENNGAEVRNISGARVYHEDLHFKPGLTYPLRTTSDFSPRILPADVMFSTGGHGIHFSTLEDALVFLGLSYTRLYKVIVEALFGGGDASVSGSAARNYTAGTINYLPIPFGLNDQQCKEVASVSLDMLESFRGEFSDVETSLNYLPANFSSGVKGSSMHRWRSTLHEWQRRAVLSSRLEEYSFLALGVSNVDLERILLQIYGQHPCNYPYENDVDHALLDRLIELTDLQLIEWLGENLPSVSRAITKKSYFIDRSCDLLCHALQVHPNRLVEELLHRSRPPRRETVVEAWKLLSYLVGLAFGRWSSDFGPLQEKRPQDTEHAFEKLPSTAPMASAHLPSQSVLDLGIDGGGLTESIREKLEKVYGASSGDVEDEICHLTDTQKIEECFTDFGRFFDWHLGQYSQSRRKAPIYWPLSTMSGSYMLWVYYPSLTSQTLYTAINDFVEPKFKQVGADVTTLRNKGSARSRDDEKQFEALQAFELELIELRDTLLKLAPTYKPNHDDGVQISAAPLWPLFRNKPWQKVLKDTWAKLEKGDYDWAHLAMNYWPERVREKCKTDKSLAIAHGLEHLYVEPEAQPKKARGRKKAGGNE